jgi:hypothetical protein
VVVVLLSLARASQINLESVKKQLRVHDLVIAHVSAAIWYLSRLSFKWNRELCAIGQRILIISPHLIPSGQGL